MWYALLDIDSLIEGLGHFSKPVDPTLPRNSCNCFLVWGVRISDVTCLWEADRALQLPGDWISSWWLSWCKAETFWLTIGIPNSGGSVTALQGSLSRKFHFQPLSTSHPHTAGVWPGEIWDGTHTGPHGVGRAHQRGLVSSWMLVAVESRTIDHGTQCPGQSIWRQTGADPA